MPRCMKRQHDYTWQRVREEVNEYNEERVRHTDRQYGTRAFVKAKRKAYSDTSLFRWCKLVDIAEVECLDLNALDADGVTVTERSLNVRLGRHKTKTVAKPAAGKVTFHFLSTHGICLTSICVQCVGRPRLRRRVQRQLTKRSRCTCSCLDLQNNTCFMYVQCVGRARLRRRVQRQLMTRSRCTCSCLDLQKNTCCMYVQGCL
jgi:hypothetical protein